MDWILMSVGLLMLILGALIRYAKWYWLIAGYNTASVEQQNQIDIGKLSKDISIGAFTLGGIMIMSSIVTNTGFTALGHIAMIVLPFAFVLYLIVRTKHYQKQASNRNIIIILSFLGLVFLSIVILLIYSSQPATVSATSKHIQIEGIYGLQKEFEDVQDIKLLQNIPEIEWKTNGFNFGNIRKGSFTLQEWGNGKLYMTSTQPPFIFIKTDDSFILLNYSEASETNKVFNSLHSKWISSQ